MASPNRRWSSARIVTRSVPLRLDGDLVLELHEPVDDRLGTRRTAGNVDVDRADRADDEEHVGLPGREARQPGAEPIDVVVRARRRHVLHPAARRHERILEDRVFPRPADGLVELRREEAAYSHSKPPLRQTYANPSIRMDRNTSISTKPNHPSCRNSVAHGQMNRSSMSMMMKMIAIRENLMAKRPSVTAIGSLPHSKGALFTGVSRRGAIRLGMNSSAPATSAANANTMRIGA